MPPQKRSKIHHYIPKTLQRRFTLSPDSEKIWYAEKGFDGVYGSPELRNISSTFKVRNFYTITHDGQKSDIIEREIYGPLDDALGKFIDRTLEAFNRGVIPVLGGEYLTGVRNMILMMIRRTPYFVRDYDDEKTGREVITEMLENERHKLSNADISQLEENLNDPAYLAELGRDARVRASVSKMEKSESILDEFAIRWVRPERKSSFILSSLGVVRIGNGGPNGLAFPDAEAWMPISPKLCAVMVRDKQNRIPFISEFDQKSVREVNDHLTREGQAIASHSEKLLHSLLSRRMKRSG